MKYKSKAQIVAEIKKRHGRREPLNISAVRIDDPDLLDAAFAVDPFLGWKRAIEAAGLSYGSIDTRYIEEIECRVCGDYFKNIATHLILVHDYETEDYLEEFPDAVLKAESMRFRRGGKKSQGKLYIRDWEPALSHEYCLDKVYAYYEKGIEINHANLSPIDPVPMIKLTSELGIIWDDVLEMLGFDPRGHRKVVRRDDFTIEEFRAWLTKREKQGLKNTWMEVGEIEQEIEKGNESLNCRIIAWAMAFHNRSWICALRAAKVDLGNASYNMRGYPDVESVLQAIREIDESGRPTAHGDAVRHPDDSKVVWAAHRYFKTWGEALKAAKVKARSKGTRFNTKAQLDRGLRLRIKNGLTIDPYDMFHGGRSDIILFKSASNYYDTWHAAIDSVSGGNRALVKQAKGKDNPYPTEASVKKELKRLHKNKELVAERKMARDRSFKYLSAMAHFYFGGWGKAATAAGIDTREYHKWNRESPAFYANKEEVIEGIQWRHSEGFDMNARSVATGEQMDVPLIFSARRLFGDWEGAMEAAGFDYSQFVRKKQDYSIKRELNDYPTKQAVIEGIKQRVKDGKKLNIRTMRHGDDRDHPLTRLAIKLFGSWDAALEAAGQDPSKIRKKQQDYSKMRTEYNIYDSQEEVIAEIKKRHKAGKRLTRKILSSGDDHERDFALWKTGCALFETWENALESAAIDLKEVFPDWQLQRMENFRKKSKTTKKAAKKKAK